MSVHSDVTSTAPLADGGPPLGGASEADQAPGRVGVYAWYVAAVLALGQMVAFLDRVVFSLLVGPIKSALHLSDTQLGLLNGLGFALLYCALSVPVGRLIDLSRRRRTIIIVGVMFWSAMTAFCGFARSFWLMFAARVGVGFGETTLMPGAASMLGDYFSPQRLGRAMSLFGVGAYVGTGLAFLGGGYLLQLVKSGHGHSLMGGLATWQIAFLAASLPGFCLCLLLWTIREPSRRIHPKAAAHGATATAAFVYLWRNRGSYGRLFAFTSVVSLFVNSTNAWLPTFLARKFAMTPGQGGVAFGVVVLCAGTTAIFAGGWIADKLWSRRRYTGYMAVCAFASLAALLPGALYPLARSLPVALGGLSVFYFFAVMPISASIAALQLMTPPQMRGQVTAIFLAVVSLVGVGVGPALVAVLTDFAYGGPAGLPYSLATMSAVLAPLATLAAATNWRRFVQTAGDAGTLPVEIEALAV
jgi:MFS family permease